jgi:phosphate transport system substrate-binding protein
MKSSPVFTLLFGALLFATVAAIAQDTNTATLKAPAIENDNQSNNRVLIAGQSGSELYPTTSDRRQRKFIAITGVRFAYPLVQKWIDDYSQINPDVQIIIESRGSNDPTTYDILIEAYEPEAEIKKKRDYVYIGRYAILPVANSQSAFSKVYSAKGLNQDLIKQLFFYDIFSDKKQTIKEPHTVYTRLQKAGAPITFSKYFGYQQKDIHGKSIAGADEHLLKAVLRDSTAISYLPLNFLYDLTTGKPIPGITIIPVDLNGNDKVSDEERIYGDMATVIKLLEERDPKEMQNIPIEYLHLSVNKDNSNPEVSSFLQWIIKNGDKDLHAFGFLRPDSSRAE